MQNVLHYPPGGTRQHRDTGSWLTMAMFLVLSLGEAVGDSVITMCGVSGRRVWHRQWRIAFGAASNQIAPG